MQSASRHETQDDTRERTNMSDFKQNTLNESLMNQSNQLMHSRTPFTF